MLLRSFIFITLITSFASGYNPKHLAILKQGVSAWNNWREANSNIYPDLSKANLSYLNLTSSDFKNNRNRLHATMKQASYIIEKRYNYDINLINVNLSGANLRFSNLQFANLSGANLSGAFLEGTILTAAKLQQVNLENTKCSGSHFNKAIFVDVNCRKALFLYANFTKAKFARCDLFLANFSGANLAFVKFVRCSSEKAKFEKTKLQKSVFLAQSF